MTQVPGWYPEFVAAVVARLPRGIDEATATAWTQDPDGLERALGVLGGSGAGLPAATAGDGPLKHDKTSDGWNIVVDVPGPVALSADSVKLLALGEEGEYLVGEDAVAKVEELDGLLGQRHAEYLLDHPDELPEEFQKFSLVFAGIMWVSPEGNHQVPCATWRNGSWEFTFGILEGGLDSRDRLVQGA